MDTSDIEDIVKRKQRAIRKGNLRGAVEVGNELGFCYTNLGRYDEALEEYKQCLDLTTSSNDLMGQATAHRYIGETLSKTNSYCEALKHHRQYLELAIKCKSQVEEQRAYTTLGNTHLDFASTRMKDIEGRSALRKAEESFSLALNFSEKVKALISKEEYAQMKARLYMNLALVYELYQEEEMCINYFQQSIKISSENSLTEDLYRSMYNLSQYYKRCSKFKEAIDKCKQACNCALKLKDDRMEMEASILLAKIHLTTSDFKLAKESLSTIYKKRHCRKTDEFAEAERMLKKVFKLLHLIEDIEIISKKDAKTLRPLYEKAGDKAVALESFEFALCAYKNMEKCAKALGIKGKQLCPAYFSIWKTLKDLHRYPECLSYLEKEEKLEADNPKRLYKILLEKAELLEFLKHNYEDVAEIYKSAYQQAELQESHEKKVYSLKKLLLWQQKENKMDDTSSTKTLLESMVGKEQTNKASMLTPTFSDEEEEEEEAEYDSDDDFELDKEIDLCSDNESEEKPIHKNPKANILGETPLHRASIEGNLRRVKALLDKGHPVNVRDNCGWLPIHEAASNGFAEIAEILLDKGASINDRGGEKCQGFTPLHDACSNAHVDVIELLVRRGAELLLKNDLGDLPIDTLDRWCEEWKDEVPTEVQSCLKMLREQTEKQKAALLRSFGSQGSGSSRQKELVSTPSVSCPKPILKKTRKSPSPPGSPTNENNRMEDIQCVSSPETSQRRVKKKLATSKKFLKKSFVSKANKPSLEVFDDAVPTPKTGLKTALVKESECVGLKDWLVDDVSTPAEEDLENDRLKMRRPVDLLPSSSKRASKRTSSSSSDDDRGTSKPLTKICKTIESSHSQDSKILQSNFNNEQRPFAEVEVSPREPASIKKWVNVTVGDKSIGVPFVERDRTVSRLAEEVASRYYTILGKKPRLTLAVRGMILMPEDPTEGLFCNGEEVVASVAEWINVPIETRCEDACRSFSSTMTPSIKKAIVECEESGFLDLSEKSLEPPQFRSACHVMQSLTSLTQLHLKGNKLRNEGFQLLVDIFKFLPYLSLVDLSSNHITHESIAELSKHLRGHAVQEKKPLQSLEVLLLANNHLLDLSGTHLFECLEHLPSLKHLDLSGCGLTEKFFDDRDRAVKSLGGGLLSYLDLGGNNNLKRMDPKALVRCFNFNRLETLHLPQVQIGFVQLLKKHLENLDGEVDFRFLSIDGKHSL